MTSAHPSLATRLIMTRAAARAAVRETRAALRGLTRPVPDVRPSTVLDGVPVTLRRLTVREAGVRRWWTDRRSRWSIVRDSEAVGTVTVLIDAGTGTAEITAAVRPGALRSVMTVALRLTLDDLVPGVVRPAVRVPVADPSAPDAQQLTDAGLHLVATFAGNPEGALGWAGEQRWEPAAPAIPGG